MSINPNPDYKEINRIHSNTTEQQQKKDKHTYDREKRTGKNRKRKTVREGDRRKKKYIG